ncbi:hypothetical protein VE03_10650 [Pseudogymnoascus sp. 23342-1-I1]|nr:hypothetical protein VE03_10650 [Pseudogymnoascus sp. 23342-1-I1]
MEKRLGNVTKGIKQQLSGTDKVTATLKQVNRRLKRIDLNMFRGMRDLNNHLRLARAREKYLVRCVEKLVQEAHPDVPGFDVEGAPHQYEDTIARN